MFAWHVHHTRLYEALEAGGIEKRANYIKAHKPAKERPRRLRLLKAVQSQHLLNCLHQALCVASTDPLWGMVQRTINALHREECKRCTWNGKTIFPKGVS
jgi:hypothetical protein